MTLLLRKVVHPTAIDNYRVVYDDVEVGSIGIQMGTNAETFWAWGLIPSCRLTASRCTAKARTAKTAWFSSKPLGTNSVGTLSV